MWLLAHDDGWFHHMDGWGGGWVWLWGTLMMLVWVLIIAGAVHLVVRSLSANRRPHDEARAILDERYARDEIDSDEYEEKLRHLGRDLTERGRGPME